VVRLLSSVRTLSTDASQAIGRVVAIRSWKEAAKSLADAVLEGRDDLRPAMEFCLDQVQWVRRYRLDMHATSAAKWRTLEEIGVELFPMGPGDKWLWDQAGGQNADIPRTSTGRDAWHIVVTDLENGRGKVSLRELVKAMAVEYPLNPTLEKMRNDRFFR